MGVGAPNDDGISFILGQPGRIPVPTHLYDFVTQGDRWTDEHMDRWKVIKGELCRSQ